MLRCEKCKHYNCEADKYPCAVCDSNVNDLFEEKKQTNADRIRAMSIEDMAKFLSLCVSDCQGRELEQKEFCEGCPFDSGVGYCTDKRIKKWLQSEAE